MDGYGTMEWGFDGTFGSPWPSELKTNIQSFISAGDRSLASARSLHSKATTDKESTISPMEKGTYQGSWRANKMHGEGIFQWQSGRIYLGNWMNDLKSGIGILRFKAGNEYKGEFLNDKRDGYGVYEWADKRSFKGWWH